jgi:putative transposase
MPRKPLIYLHNNPYHIVCRTNNKDFFRIPLPDIWQLLCEKLTQLHKECGFRVHSIVLMSNHYHLLASTSEPAFLSEVMFYLQNSISRSLNKKSQRINHSFGGRYKGSLITTPNYFYHATKYIYQNPVRAGLSLDVAAWPYSNLKCFLDKDLSTSLWSPPSEDIFDIHRQYPDKIELLKDLNHIYAFEQSESLRKATKKATFRVCTSSKLKKLDWL